MSLRSNSSFTWAALPNSVRAFIIAFTLSTVCDSINSMLMIEDVQVRYLMPLQINELNGAGAAYAVVAVRIVVRIAILAWIVLRYSAVGRILVGIMAVGWLYNSPSAMHLILAGKFRAIPYLLGGASCLVAFILMFAPRSREWFARKGQTLARDLETLS